MKQRILSILILAGLIAMLSAVAFGQIAATVTTTIDGKAYSGQVVLTPTTTPTTQPVVVVAASQPTTLPATADVPAVLHGRPSRDSTGIKPALTLRNSAGVKIVPGGLYDGYSFGSLTVKLAAGQIVRFTNCKFTGGIYGINANGNAGRILIDHCEFVGQDSAGVYGDGFEATSCYVHRSAGDGFKPGHDVLLQGNFVEDLGYNSPDAHADGVQIRGGANVKIIGNYFKLTAGRASDGSGTVKGNAGIFVQTASGRACSGIVAQGNWIESPNSGIHAHPSDAATTQVLMRITDNVINAKAGLEINSGTGTVKSGNMKPNGVKLAA